MLPGKLFCLAICGASLFLGSIARGDTITGPAYPPPGGVTFTPGSGAVGNTGGKTNTYSGLNPSAYGTLYFGPADSNIIVSTRNSSGDVVSFDSADSNLAGGVAVFQGTSQIFNAQFSVFQNVYTEFRLTLTDLASNPIALTQTSTISGFPGTSPVVGQITGTGFNAHWEAVGTLNSNRTGYQGINNLYNSINTSGSQVIVSFGGGFFSTAAATAPLPTTASVGIALLGTLVIARLVMRRRQLEAQTAE